ncbi:MAG: hypothetical protein IKM13_01390 [Clostridia bacterium]|nr:hypothetical protein [Oscillospiraceae bacterium]MBQ2748269.1 hypothetical protein [Clostridia bacterium]MBQ4625334.1 hypothetical protein [Clostridia bacterium]MBR6762388.1 hypothetical protein [Clostridia bacterium]
MTSFHNKDTDRLFQAILTLKTIEECDQFFDDICTIQEVLTIAQRLKTAELLKKGANYQEINRETGMSTTTISRVRRSLDYGSGGYDMVISRMEEKKE